MKEDHEDLKSQSVKMTWDGDTVEWADPPLTVNQGGVKFDQGKVPMHLHPPEPFFAIGEIWDFGQKKYSARNWEEGMDWSRPFGALMRHMWAWWGGEKKDPETGKSHLWHAGCCIFMLITYEIRGVGNDDRPDCKNST